MLHIYLFFFYHFQAEKKEEPATFCLWLIVFFFIKVVRNVKRCRIDFNGINNANRNDDNRSKNTIWPTQTNSTAAALKISMK